MKKALCVFLTIVMVFSTSTFAFAQDTGKHSPVILVTGMANTDLVLDKGLETQ